MLFYSIFFFHVHFHNSKSCHIAGVWVSVKQDKDLLLWQLNTKGSLSPREESQRKPFPLRLIEQWQHFSQVALPDTPTALSFLKLRMQLIIFILNYSFLPPPPLKMEKINPLSILRQSTS